MDGRVFFIFALLHFAQSNVLNLSCSQIKEFVDGHNSRRLELAKGEISDQPAAAEMNKIIWDETLAAKASAWASHNKFSHNPDRNDFLGRFKTGENIYMAASTDHKFKLNINNALTSWFDEHKHYTYGPLKNSDFSGSKNAIGHYTQMAWSDSTYVGCGVSEFIKNNMKEYLVVCNYGPTGNYLGETPYEAGNASEGLKCGTDNCDNINGILCSYEY